MEFKVFKAFFSVFIILLFILGTVFLVRGLTIKESKKENNSSFSSPSNIDISKIIKDIKTQNKELIYQSEKIEEFTSLVFQENNRLKSYLVDSYTGEILSISDIFKEDKIDKFNEKELELLNLKYPEFIVEGIKTSNGYKVYYVKENEMIIYYYDYTFKYDYKDTLTLTINYNEIHDYLDFTHLLDKEYTNENGYQYNEEKKTVAITFDDGPTNQYNAKYLDVLARNKAHATFFMVGSMMNSCQKCVLDTYNSGNEIASHTYNHINIKNSSIEEVEENIKKTDDLYYQITGDHIKYVRPPYGAYDKENLENVKYPLILWNLDTEDWRYRDVEHIVNYVMENVGDGSIILMHELYKTSLEALEIILPRLYAEGYQVVSVSELAKLQNKSLEIGHAYRAIMN